MLLCLAVLEGERGRELAGEGRRVVAAGGQLVVMAGLTGSVKDELSRLPAGKTCCRRAELAALLRFAGGLHLAGGRVAIEAELDSGIVTRRLRREIAELYGHPTTVRVLPAAGLHAGPRYLVRVADPRCCAGPLHRSGRPGRSSRYRTRPGGGPPDRRSGMPPTPQLLTGAARAERQPAASTPRTSRWLFTAYLRCRHHAERTRCRQSHVGSGVGWWVLAAGLVLAGEVAGRQRPADEGQCCGADQVQLHLTAHRRQLRVPAIGEGAPTGTTAA